MVPPKTPKPSTSGNCTVFFSPPLLGVNAATAIGLHTRQVPRAVGRTQGTSSRDSSSKTTTPRLSPAARLPLEIVKMIVAYLIDNTRDLVVCSLISPFWYIAVSPYRHNTFITSTYSQGKNRSLMWRMGELGFLPYVRKFQFHRSLDHYLQEISPKLFNHCILRHFLTLSNVQELGIEDLDIPSFMPEVRRYFGHFMPTVHSLALKKPKGSCRQIVHFIGLFECLEDLNLLCRTSDPPEGDLEDIQGLTPPPLRGRLTLMHSASAGILKEMVDLFGEIRFRSMNLFDVKGVKLLLDACAETLETLQIYPTDPYGEDLSLNSV